MKRKLLLAAFVAVFLFGFLASLATAQGLKAPTKIKNDLNWPDLPKINGIPSFFVTVASTTGTMTQYLEVIPITWDSTTGKLYASGVPLILETTTSATYPTSIVVSSHTVSLPAGSNTIGLFWDAALATPTFTEVSCSATPTTISPASKRAYVVIQNKHATESAYVYPGLIATPGWGIEIKAGGSVTRAWDSSTYFSVVSTNTVPIVCEQGVTP
jgi:hypothetical protein